MELREALTQIAEIRQQMARGQLFRGYRAATTAFSGLAAVGTAVLQTALLPDAGDRPLRYVLLWVTAAIICLLAVGVEMVVRTRKSASVLQKQLTLLAVEQFIPSVVAGALVTYVFCDFLSTQMWMLPGLWMILFSLGVFASARLLPRMVSAVAGFYLIAGIFELLLVRDGGMAALRFNPWMMAGPFAAGQSALAMILYVKLERDHG